MNRRDFLRAGGAAVLTQLTSCIVGGLIRKAVAEAMGLNPRNYVNIHLEGGPNRFTFDHWLQAKPGDPALDYNPHVATYLSGNTPSYQLTSYRGLQVPWLWQFDVATGNGGRRKMSDLLDHMAVIRGYSTGADGHTGNLMKQTQPVPGGVNLAGLCADRGSRLLGAIAADLGIVGLGFKSGKGFAQVKVPLSGNAVGNLLGDFKTDAPLPASLDTAVRALATYSESDYPGSDILKKDMDRAVDKMRQGVAEVDGYWSGALARYKTAIANSVRPQILYPGGIPGLTTGDLVSDGSNSYRLSCYASTTVIAAGYPLAACVQNAELTYLAELFALSEYVIVNDLAGAIELFPLLLNNITFPGTSTFNGPQTQTTTLMAGDEHLSGPAGTIMMGSMLYRGLAAGLLELVTALKAAGAFERTVIHITGDFGRTPRSGQAPDQNGADHGWDSCVTSVISGLIKSPLVAGNIYKNKYDPMFSSYPGSWGQAAPMSATGLPASPVNVGATIAHLLGIDDNPWNFNPKMLQIVNGSVQVVEEAKVL